MQVFIVNKLLLSQPWLVSCAQEEFRDKLGACWDVFSDLSFVFKFFSCYWGAIGAHETESLRKDVPEWKTLRTTLLMFMLSFFLLQLDF